MAGVGRARTPSPCQWQFSQDELDNVSLTSTAEDENEYDVECIVAERNDPDRGLEFLVRWKGFPDDVDHTWAPEADFERRGGPDIVANFRSSPRDFDLERYEDSMQRREQEITERRSKRAEKRVREALRRDASCSTANTSARLETASHAATGTSPALSRACTTEVKVSPHCTNKDVASMTQSEDPELPPASRPDNHSLDLTWSRDLPLNVRGDENKSPYSPRVPGSTGWIDPNLVTCWYWKENRTCYDSCPLEHRHTTQTADRYNELLKHQASCWHDSRGQCRFPARYCWYSHSKKPYLGPAIKGGQIGKNPSYPRNETTMSGDSPVIPVVGELLGCWRYHSDENCQESEASCSGSHRNTRFVATRTNEGAPWLRPGGKVLRDRSGQKATITPQQRSLYLRENIEQHRPLRARSHWEAPHTGSSQKMEPRGGPTYNSLSTTPPLERPRKPPNRRKAPPDHPVIALSMIGDEGKETDKLQCRIRFDSDSAESEFLALNLLTWSCSHFCKGSDAKHFFPRDAIVKSSQGKVFPESSSLEVTLKAYAGAAICNVADKITIFVFPPGSEWYDILKTSERTRSTFGLRFCVVYDSIYRFVGSRGPNDMEGHNATDDDKQSHERFNTVLRLPNDGIADRNVMLIYSEEDDSRFCKVAAYLQSQGASVYINHNKGSWDFFWRTHSASETSTVLFQHEIDAWDKITKFSQCLYGYCKVVSLGPGNDIAQEPMVRFPHGLAVLITDDCITEYPDEMLPALQLLRKRKTLLPTCVCGRLDFVEWLKNHKTSCAGPQSEEVLQMIKLLELELDRIRDLRVMGSSGTVDATNCPFDAAAPVDTQEHDSDAATCALLHWFNGWSKRHCNKIRRFAVLVPGSFARRLQWAEQYRHMSILTPQAFVYKEKVRIQKSEANISPAKKPA